MVHLGEVVQHMITTDVEAMDTSITNATIAKSDIFGVVLPSNISTGVFVHVAGDKNDNN